jgi:hypothetical protein
LRYALNIPSSNTDWKQTNNRAMRRYLAAVKPLAVTQGSGPLFQVNITDRQVVSNG